MKHNFEKYLCIAFVAAMTAPPIGVVGTLPTDTAKPYSWTLVLSMLVLTGMPALLGYLAGRKDSDEG